MIPRSAAARKTEDEDVLRAKSFLFFYALQDRYGQEVFRHAINHMLSARQGRGFDLDDLIAAFEEETHQNVAEFIRLWMKHPGVPDEFRTRYENASASIAITSKETIP
jgi:aminopeptidase N